MLIIIIYLMCIMCYMEDFSLLPGGCNSGGKRYDKSVITKQTWFWDLIYNEIKYDNGGHFYIFITLLFEQHKLETNTHKSVLKRTAIPNTFDKTSLVIWTKTLVSCVYFKIFSLNIFFETQCYLQMLNKFWSTLIVI